jgi:XTP/dITP diphosphohydrolase
MAKLIYRADKYGVPINIPPYSGDHEASEESVGAALASVIAWAYENNIDPESALRAQARAVISQIQLSEESQ